MNPTDKINPAHYREHPSGVECITITEHFNFNLGNVIKYVWRAGLKNSDSVEDLSKAKWYLEREIDRVQFVNTPIKTDWEKLQRVIDQPQAKGQSPF